MRWGKKNFFFERNQIFYMYNKNKAMTEQKCGRQELPHTRGQGRRPRGATPRLRSGEAAERSYPAYEVRGSGQECQAATAQEQLGGATPGWRPGTVAGRSYSRSKERWGAGGLRGATPRSRSGGVVVRRYPSSKVRSSGCALLEQPSRDTPHPR